MTTTEVGIIDADSHITEPPDVWTARISTTKWKDAVPQLVYDERFDVRRWRVGDVLLVAEAQRCMGGWKEPVPAYPRTLDEADPAVHDPAARVQRMDEWGIQAQLLYPNLIGFWTDAFSRLDRELGFECVRAYNDFLTDFAAVAPGRFVPIMMLPFWDVDESVRELERAANNGHKGILFAAHFDRLGIPDIRHERWHPVLDAAQGNELPVNFHIGFGSLDAAELDKQMIATESDRMESVNLTAGLVLANSSAIGKITLGGVCHRYPRLDFVSVESGFGYIPFILQSFDWNFVNFSVNLHAPELQLPSEYFHRQIYATSWFESFEPDTLDPFQDNVMFSTDFPHPQSLTPGPYSAAKPLREQAASSVGKLAPSVQRKILHDNAARVYHL